MSEIDILAWWSELPQAGWLLSPEALAGLMELAPPPLPRRRAENLHAAVTQFLEADSPARKPFTHLIDLVLQDALGYSMGWLKPSAIGADWAQRSLEDETIKPQRLWKGRSGGLLPVFLADPQLNLSTGRGRKLGARAMEWLRQQGVAIALLTNGAQWRLIQAGPDQSSHVEWNAADWFAAGRPTSQFDGLRHVLGIQALRPSKSTSVSPLMSALQASRSGRSELSQQMGERVRQAVELLISAQGRALDAVRMEVPPRMLYVAACRIVMRLVVLLFAEARGLLPTDNPIYLSSYGLSSLQDLLKQSEPAYSAWPRLLGAFRLVYEGSHHRDLVVPAYGGELFEAGDAASSDPLSRAIAALESPDGVSDRAVGEILELLCRTHVRIQVGRQATRMTVPVDFSDLSTAYIGILYEGLLDYELRHATHDPVLFLNLGKQPAMPLSQLESLDEKALKALLDGLNKRGDDEESTSMEAMAEAAPAPDADAQPPEDTPHRAYAWARRAVETGKLLGARDLADPVKREQAARALIKRIVLPGEWYLVRWGGTRKGSGSFYTRPELTQPMVSRTLHPLVYEPPSPDVTGSASESEPPLPACLREPEAILALSICDPSMGSGSFLVAALRYLTDALVASLYAHGRIQAHGRRTVVTLASGTASCGELCEEALPLPPDDENFEPALRARLKRHLVERCLYGVDLDPLAVELGKLALWVETMDRELPFSFLDHKLKVGNALVGAFFDGFLKYPLMAWEREGGDKGHRSMSFPQDAWSTALKAKRTRVRTELDQLLTGSLNWLNEDRSSAAIATHAQVLETLTTLHRLPVHRSDLKAQIYRTEITESPALQDLKRAFDTYCAIWFWPADQLDTAPTPLTYLNPAPETLAMVDHLAEKHRFFHWELAFPDVFTAPRAGFDAVVGNPPWETQKPNSQEFFSNHDALYRTYGKQEALRQQQRYFQSDPSLELKWLEANATLKAQSNWVRFTASPFGEAVENSPWGRQFNLPEGYCDPEHPFHHQGSADPNTYKMFLEMSHALLKPGGQMGLIVPSSLYSDKGAQALRELFLERCRWRWLFAFENRQKIFDIDSRFKFCMIILQKGGSTQTLRTAFMRQDRFDWERAEEIAFAYEASLATRFSPKSLAFLELEGRRDVDILRRIYANSVLLGETGEGGWGLQSGREFHMTDDSSLFGSREAWEARGYRPDPQGRWVNPKGEMALPLYQGVMIHQYDYSAKAWLRGTGLAATWESIPWQAKRLAPQFLMAREDALRKGDRILAPKVTYRSIARNTDERTLIASLNPGLPCGHKLGVLRNEDPLLTCALPALLNSFVLDWVARIRIGGTQVDAHVVAELPLVPPRHDLIPILAANTLRLNGPSPLFAPLWLALRPFLPEGRSPDSLYCLTPHERLRVRCITEALVAWLYGLRLEDLSMMLSPDPSKARGFWRVDRDLSPELRLTTLTLEAFKALLADGPFRFLEQHEGEGWMLPETLEVDGETRDVRSALGPRFHPWQLAASPDESWATCRSQAQGFEAPGSLPSPSDSSSTMGRIKQPSLF